METDEIAALLGIVSLGLGVFGFFYMAIFMGPPALICGVISLYLSFKAEKIETVYRIVALAGLLLGLFEIIFATLGLLGLLPQI